MTYSEKTAQIIQLVTMGLSGAVAVLFGWLVAEFTTMTNDIVRLQEQVKHNTMINSRIHELYEKNNNIYDLLQTEINLLKYKVDVIEKKR